MINVRKLKRKWGNVSKNNKMIFLLLCCLCFITVGYAAINQVLKIAGYASIDKGDGMIFTSIGIKENNNASIEKDASIKAKTLVNTQIGFSGEGSITFNVSAQNQGTTDAKLIEIKGLNEHNTKEPTCIKTTVQDHEVGDLVYPNQVKNFTITITSTCTSYSSKEFDLHFVYQKQETINGVLPKYEGTLSDYLIDRALSDDIQDGVNGFYSIGQSGELTTSDNPREYRYIGADPNNYVMFNNELWRIIGLFDGEVKLAREKDELYAFYSTSGDVIIDDYLKKDVYETISEKNKEYISSHTWDVSTARVYNGETAQQFYEDERNPENPSYGTWNQEIALPYMSDYGFATSGGSTTSRETCLNTNITSWQADCENNNWLNNKKSYWSLIKWKAMSEIYRFPDGNSGSGQYNSYVKATLFLKSDVMYDGGTGTKEDPFVVGETNDNAASYLISNSNIQPIDDTSITDSLYPDEYRYVGVSADNYVKFNNELWRIIGIFNQRLKIIRAEELPDWKMWDENMGIAWEDSTLKNYLNDEYYNQIDIVDRLKIDSVYFPTGQVMGSDWTTTKASSLKGQENGRINNDRWYGNVGIMYASDFALSTNGATLSNGTEVTRDACLDQYINDWDQGRCYFTWLYRTSNTNSSNEWTMTRFYQTGSKNVIYKRTQGDVYYTHTNSGYAIRPTVYLDVDVNIVSGSGTSEDPYILANGMDRELKVGDTVYFNPFSGKDCIDDINHPSGQCFKWYVVSTSMNNVDMILSKGYNSNVKYESGTAMNSYISSQTTRWYGIETFNIGDTDRISGALVVEGLKARLLRYSELASITGKSTTTIQSITNVPTWLTENLETDQGYWMGQANSSGSQVYAVYGDGQMKLVAGTTSLQYRPVIRVQRSMLN